MSANEKMNYIQLSDSQLELVIKALDYQYDTGDTVNEDSINKELIKTINRQVKGKNKLILEPVLTVEQINKALSKEAKHLHVQARGKSQEDITLDRMTAEGSYEFVGHFSRSTPVDTLKKIAGMHQYRYDNGIAEGKALQSKAFRELLGIQVGENNMLEVSN